MPLFHFIARILFFVVVFSIAEHTHAAEKKTYEALRPILKWKARNGTLLAYTKTLYKEEFISAKEWYRTMNRIEAIADNQNLADYPYICLHIAQYLYDRNDFNTEYYYLFKTHEYLLKNYVDDEELISEVHRMLGESYLWFQRYDDAKKQLLLSNSWKEMSPHRRISVLNTLGLINRSQHYFYSSSMYYKKALQIAQQTNDRAWIGVLSGNLGYNYYIKGDYNNALPLLEKDFQISVETNQNGSAFQAIAYLIIIDIKKKLFDKAEEKLLRMEQMLTKIHTPEKEYRLHHTKALFFEAKGDYKNAWINYRKTKKYEETSLRQHDFDNIQKTEFRINFERKQAEIRLLKEKRERSRIILIGVVIITLLLCIIFFISFRSVQRQRKRDRELMALKQQQLAHELEETEARMHEVLSKLIEKNEVVEQLTEEVGRYHASEQSTPSRNQAKIMDRLQSITILTDDDWLEFKRLFTKLNPGFFQRIQAHLPDLTNAELRLIALIKLNLSIVEIARVLGISPDSVRKTSLRLRKKLNIEQHEELVQFVSSN